MQPSPVILHIPHASALIPDAERAAYNISDAELACEHLRIVDLHTDDLYDLPGAARLVFPVSRFLVDPERFADEAQEPMATRGMGVLYVAGTDLQPIRALSATDRARLMERHYWPHHRALDALARDAVAAHGDCLIIDCHSYPSRALPYEGNNRLLRPQIGIGIDPVHTPPALSVALAAAFARRGYETGFDTPFAGTMVPNAFYGRDRRVRSIMIEVRKDLYMEEATGIRTTDFDRVRRDITAAMTEIATAHLPVDKTPRDP